MSDPSSGRRRTVVSGTLGLVGPLLLTSATVTFSIDHEPGDHDATTPIDHVVVVIQQDHSFDNYFGTYPGADGIPPGTCMPIDPVQENDGCVEPYHIGEGSIQNLRHSRETFERQYRNGSMDGFVWAHNRTGQDGRIAMGYYDDTDLPYYWNLADEHVLFDRFFGAASGGSIWNRMYAISAVAGSEDDRIPSGGYQDIPTIFDLLQEHGISWKFYVRNYDPSLTFRDLVDADTLPAQLAWVPLLNIERFVDDPALAGRIVDLDEYFVDLEAGTLPNVAYVVALGATEQPVSRIQLGQRVVRSMIQALMESDAWERSAFILTYDDWGGWYDHVPPPQIDAYGYGFRVPAVLVSPYARRGYVDSTVYDVTSILRFIEENWGLEPLSERDANANSLANAFDFSQPPRPAQFLPGFPRELPRTTVGASVAIYATYGAGITFAVVVLAWAARSRRARHK